MSIFGGELVSKKHYVTMAQRISALASEVAVAAFHKGDEDPLVDQSGDGPIEEKSSLPMTGVDALNVRRAFPARYKDRDERLKFHLKKSV